MYLEVEEQKEDKMKGFFEAEEQDINYLEERYRRKPPTGVFGLKEKRVEKEVSYPPKTTPCQCQIDAKGGAIFCDRHQCTKTKNMQELCSFDQRYFDLWEMGEGPMQNLEENKINTQEMIAQEDIDLSGFFMGDPEIPKISRGFGDTFAKFTKATGLKKATKLLFGIFNADCGCTERQAKWNRLFPYKKRQQETKKTKGFFE